MIYLFQITKKIKSDRIMESAGINAINTDWLPVSSNAKICSLNNK
jgi:hypothetical protein